MCCDECCKEFKGWCQSFTRTERALTILEAVLLVILIVFLIFLILHLLACSTPEPKSEKPGEEIEELEENEFEEIEYSSAETTEHTTRSTTTKKKPTTRRVTTTTQTARQTIEPGRKCSWTPSAKTPAFTHYYKKSSTRTKQATSTKLNAYTRKPKTRKTKTRKKLKNKNKKVDSKFEQNVDFIQVDQSDGEDADSLQSEHVLALVKLKPPQDVVFGCILTIINKFYVLTSASCIEAIEEVDSLDSFVIMEQYGTSSNGKIHSILDLQIHPFYQGVNKSFDLAVIKSESSFVNGQAVKLPAPLDYAMITIGDRFHILGFGSYRSIDKSSSGRSLRRAVVYRLPALQCPRSALWAARHLAPGWAVPPAPAPARGGAPALCAGALYARGLPCNYCSGTPLLRERVLVGLMSDNQQCGVACEPQLYVNIAAVREWIHSVMKGE